MEYFKWLGTGMKKSIVELMNNIIINNNLKIIPSEIKRDYKNYKIEAWK